MAPGDYRDRIRASLEESSNAIAAFLAQPGSIETIDRIAEMSAACFVSGGKLLACGNGGSACDALHLAEEFTGRYRKDRKALPAIALAEAAYLTCVGNDYGFDEVFARGVQAYGRPGDVLFAISTSGNSRNVIRAVEEARAAGVGVVLMLGRDGGRLKGRGDAEIIVQAPTTDRIQEVHMAVLHIVIESVERRMFPENYV